MYQLPPALFNLSLTASFVILAVLLARFLLRKTPRVYSYALWAVVAFRLICPISFSSTFSILGLINAPVAETGQVEYVPVDIVHTPFPSVDLILPEINESINEKLPQGAEQLGADPLEAPAALAASIWLIGVSFLLIWALSSYLSLHKKMRTAILLEGNVFQSDQVGSPFILGLLRPKIYIPFGLDDSTLRYVLVHEKYHLKRLDHIVKVFSFAILIIHWFNPLCWLAFHLMSKDMEMSCDEKVLSNNSNSKTEYSTVLLSFAANRRFPSPSPLSFGETSAKSRIKNALNWKRPKVWATILAVVLCIAVIATCAADPKEKDSFEIKNPYDWTSTVKQNDIYGVSIQLLNTGKDTAIDLDPDGIQELITCLNNITPADFYTGRGIPAQIKVKVALANEKSVLLHYGATYTEIICPGVSSNDGIWMIHDTELQALLSEWLVQLQQANGNTEVPGTPVPSYSGVIWEYAPLLSSRYPAFPFHFNVDYTHIEASCSEGRLIEFDRSTGRTKSQEQSLTFAAGKIVYWGPYNGQLICSSADINFTVFNENEVLHTGTIRINKSGDGSIPGSTLYTSELIHCNGLIMTLASNELGGGVLTQISNTASPGIHNLSKNGSISLFAETLSQYSFKTNSSMILVDFTGNDAPIKIKLFSTNSDVPVFSFSTESPNFTSFSCSDLSADKEYYLSADCSPETQFTISDGCLMSNMIHPINTN